MSSAIPVWNSPASLMSGTSAAFGMGQVYYSSFAGFVHALDYQDGTNVWTTGEFIVGHLTTSPAYQNGVVYFADDKGYLYAVNAVDGSQMWSVQVVTSSSEPVVLSTPVVATTQPAIFGITVLYICSQTSLYCVQATTGSASSTEVYQSPTSLNPFGAPVYNMASQQIFVLEANGVSALQASTINCTLLWGPAFGSSSGITTPVTVAANQVFVSVDNVFYALDIVDGQPIASLSQNWGSISQPVAVTSGANGPLIALVTDDGLVYAIEQQGATFNVPAQWPASPMAKPGPMVAPAISNGLIYTAGNDGTVYGIQLDDSTESITWPTGGKVIGLAGVSNGTAYFGVEGGTAEATGGLQAVNFTQAANAFSVQCEFIQDFNDAAPSGTVNQVPMFHCHLRLLDQNNNPLPGEVIQVTASEEVDITVNSAPPITVSSSLTANLTADSSGTLTITIPANSNVVAGQATGLCCPMLTFWGDFMVPGERIVVYPDQPLHDRLSTISGDTLQAATSYGSDTIVPTVPSWQVSPGTTMLPSGYQGSAGLSNANTVAQTIQSSMGGANAANIEEWRATLASSPYIAFPNTSSHGVSYSSSPSFSPRQVATIPNFQLTFKDGEPSYSELPPEELERAVADIMRQHNISDAADFLGLSKFIDNVVNDVETVVDVVVNAMVATINTVKNAYSFVVGAVEDAASMVLGLLNSIVNAVESAVDSIIQALSLLFDFKNIFNTYQMISTNIETMLKGLSSNLGTLLAEDAGGTAGYEKFFSVLGSDLKSLFGDALSEPAGTPGGSTPPSLGGQSLGGVQQPNADPSMAYNSGPNGPGTGPNNSVSSTSFTQKTKSHMANSSQSSAALAVALSGTLSPQAIASQLQSFIEGAASAASSELKSKFTELISQLGSFASDLVSLQSTSMSDLLQIFEDIIDLVVTLAETITPDFIGLIQQLSDGLFEFLTQEIDIPVISDLFQWITGDTLNLLDLFALVIAFPVTIVYEAVTGQPPVSDAASEAEWGTGMVGYSITMIIYGLFENFTDNVMGTAGQLSPASYFALPPLILTAISLLFLWMSFDPEMWTSQDSQDDYHNQIFFAIMCFPLALGLWNYVYDQLAVSFNTTNMWYTFYGCAALVGSIVFAIKWPSTWSDPFCMSLISNLLGALSPMTKVLQQEKGGTQESWSMLATLDLVSGVGCGVANAFNWPGLPWASPNNTD